MKLSEEELNQLKYPVGSFHKPQEMNDSIIKIWIDEIRNFPKELEELTSDLSHEEMLWQYRPNGWNIKQVIHHCADSHMNAFIRFKLTLTEDSPTVKPYFEDRWAELPDSQLNDIDLSLCLLKGLHERWFVLLKNLSEESMTRTFTHPEHGRKIRVIENIGIYAWHSRHHLAHVKNALIFKNKFLKDS